MCRYQSLVRYLVNSDLAPAVSWDFHDVLEGDDACQSTFFIYYRISHRSIDRLAAAAIISIDISIFSKLRFVTSP